MVYIANAPDFGTKLYSDLDLNGRKISGAGILTGRVDLQSFSALSNNIPVTDCNGSVLLASRDTSNSTFVLPVAEIGMMFTAYVQFARVLNVTPNGGDRIVMGSTLGNIGQTIASGGSIGEQLGLMCIALGSWVLVQRSGAWLFV